MQLQRNLLAGLLNSIWTALATFAVVPFYIDYLGIEAYGVIGFFITLQGVCRFRVDEELSGFLRPRLWFSS